MQALAEFKEGKIQALVATDIAARGLDIDDLPCVVNFELPHSAKDYVHRIGRTGRAGTSGKAISLVSPEEKRYLSDIEQLIKRAIPLEALPGYGAEHLIEAAGHDRYRERSNERARPRPVVARNVEPEPRIEPSFESGLEPVIEPSPEIKRAPIRRPGQKREVAALLLPPRSIPAAE